jgi:GNAT superfamily N-acetyltransferase
MSDMPNEENELQPVFLHVEPVLAVTDITATISYWQDVLGFPAKWTWGEPPVHGGVSWQKIFIQFTLDAALAESSAGNSIWIRVQRLEKLYKLHQTKNADIVAPLELRPWGLAEYTVRDINDYYIHFAGLIDEKEKGEATLSKNIRIIERIPTVTEYRYLALSVGWSPPTDDDMINTILSAAIFGVVAEDKQHKETIGCALLLGDNVSFYYVKDVMVHPQWQRKRVGTALMQALTKWLEKNGSNHALAALITGDVLESFYQQFGFAKAFAMIRYIQQSEK